MNQALKNYFSKINREKWQERREAIDQFVLCLLVFVAFLIYCVFPR